MSAIIGVVNEKGGVGKTTIAVHLATYLERTRDPKNSEEPVSVAIVDCDTQLGAASWLCELDSSSSYFENADTWQPPVYVVSEAKEASKIITRAAREHDIVVVDGPAGLQDTTRQIIYLSDLLVVPVGMSVLETAASADAVDMIETAKAAIASRGGRSPMSCLALNRVKPNTIIGRELRETLEQLETPILETELGDRNSYLEAAQERCTVWDLPASKAQAASDQMSKLCAEVFNQVSVAMQEGG